MPTAPDTTRRHLPPHPAPMPHVAAGDALRVSGPAQLASLVDRLVSVGSSTGALRSTLHLEANMTGSDIAFAALTTGRADLALVGRRATESELKAFEWVFRYPPTATAVMSGSVSCPGRSPAIAVLVHATNPIVGINLRQLGGIFGAGSRGVGVSGWGDLGVPGEWHDAPINIYAPDAYSGTGQFFRDVVLDGSTKLNWTRLTEFAEPVSAAPDAPGFSADVAHAVGRDRYGLGLGVLPSQASAVRAIPVAATDRLAPVLPTEESVIAGDYPFARRVYAYYNAPPAGRPTDAVSAFLGFVLSPVGQRTVRSHGDGYLPLNSG